MIRKVAVLVLAILMGVVSFGCSSESELAADSSDGPKVWKFAHEEVNGSVQDEYALKIKEIIEEKSNGEITIEVYPVGQLGDGTDQVELLQNGAIELAINNPGAVGTLVPESNIFSLHFLLPSDMEKTREVLNNSKAIDKLNEKYEANNMKVLDWFPEGYMMWSGNKPIRSPEDFKGFKIRTMASPIITACYEAYGANPTPVPYMEVYSSLQLNMLDGQVNPIFAIEEMKFYEVQDYLMLSKQDIFVGTFVANKNFWESLTDEEQKMLEEAAQEANAYIFDVQENLNNDRLDLIKENSDIEVIELTDDEREVFRKASEPVYDKYKEMYGSDAAEIFDLLQEDIKTIN